MGQGYVFTGVCDSVHRRGVCLSTCWDTPPGSTHPRTRYTPQTRYTPRTRYTPQEQTPPRTRYNPPDQVHPKNFFFCIFLPFSPLFSKILINYFIICSLPLEQCMLGDTGNKRGVRILLECILVMLMDHLMDKMVQCKFDGDGDGTCKWVSRVCSYWDCKHEVFLCITFENWHSFSLSITVYGLRQYIYIHVSKQNVFVEFKIRCVPLTTNSAITSTRIQQADFFASKSLTTILKKCSVTRSSFFYIFLLVGSGTQCNVFYVNWPVWPEPASWAPCFRRWRWRDIRSVGNPSGRVWTGWIRRTSAWPPGLNTAKQEQNVTALFTPAVFVSGTFDVFDGQNV